MAVIKAVSVAFDSKNQMHIVDDNGVVWYKDNETTMWYPLELPQAPVKSGHFQVRSV
jgi:hypothetical protein